MSGDREWPLSPTLAGRFYPGLESREGGCLAWTGYIGPNGYGQIGNGNKKIINTHRAAWLLKHGEIPDGLSVCHTCDNRWCCNVEHLFLGTQADNMADMQSKGRDRKALGIHSSNGRLTWNQVCDIRARWIPGVPAGHGVSTGNARELAEEFGVTRQYISQLCQGKWRRSA